MLNETTRHYEAAQFCSTLVGSHGRFARLWKMGRSADFMLLEFETEGGQLRPFAVLLLDLRADQLYIQPVHDFTSIAPPEDAPILRGMVEQLARDASQMGGGAALAGLEDSLSNAIRITDRTRLEVKDIPTTLADLFASRVLRT